jgi:transcriptional regulator with XRE-family HTH domain
MELKRLGVIIKRLRNRNNLTQAELAEKSELSVNYIGDIENGRKSISLIAFFKISKALQLRADHLLKFYFEENEDTMAVTFDTIKQAYQSWKSLNEIISNQMDSRKVNLPEAISENIACHALGYTRNMTNTGDATDKFGNLIEVKATANFHDDLSSFSPDTHFDKLIFVRLNLETDQAFIYDLGLNGKQFGELSVNRTETVADHQKQGRRPRLSLIKYIESKNIQPVKIVDLA